MVKQYAGLDLLVAPKGIQCRGEHSTRFTGCYLVLSVLTGILDCILQKHLYICNKELKIMEKFNKMYQKNTFL